MSRCQDTPPHSQHLSENQRGPVTASPSMAGQKVTEPQSHTHNQLGKSVWVMAQEIHRYLNEEINNLVKQADRFVIKTQVVIYT